jgi:hypothetical protein
MIQCLSNRAALFTASFEKAEMRREEEIRKGPRRRNWKRRERGEKRK